VPVELLVEAILWPQRQIKEGFVSTSITTKSGRAISGYLENNDKQNIVIRDAATGVTHTIPAQQILTREDAGSLMPPGLTSGLTRSELRDLIRYLSELKG
jgi:putative heme-binding domain-containing protein